MKSNRVANNQVVNIVIGAGLLGLVTAMPASAEFRMKSEPMESEPQEQQSVTVDSVQIHFKVKKSTFENFPLPRLDESGLAGAYLPGAFEPTAAGEVENVAVVEDNRNDDALRKTNLSDIRDQNISRAALYRAFASVGDSGFSRSSGNVTGNSDLSTRSR